MRPQHTAIRWHRPQPTAAAAPERRMRSLDVERFDMGALVERVGVPVVEDAETARDAALTLLRVAAEVEQALMVQYLYAAVSVSPDSDQHGVNHRQALLRIAVQEMGHLATLQNLLLLLGGPDAFHLQRGVLRLTSEENPIPFVLEPVSAASIATYVVAEMPAVVPPELAEQVDELIELAEKTAGDDLHRVGVIYELLLFMFGAQTPVDFAVLAPLPDPPTLTDADLQTPAIVARHEGRREEWGVFDEDIILPTVTTLAEARAALAAVAAQGEGLEDLENSHFGAFMRLNDAFHAGDVVVRPMATAPTVDAAAPASAAPITHPYSRLWAQVFNTQYELLVVSILHAFATPRSDDGDGGRRQQLATLALGAMRSVIVEVADLIIDLPLRADGSGTAGPPFALDPALLESNDDAQLTARQLGLLDQLGTWYAAIEADPAFTAHPDHANALVNLRKFDARRRNVVAPPPPPGG
jgi:hypothetical protein